MPVSTVRAEQGLSLSKAGIEASAPSTNPSICRFDKLSGYSGRTGLMGA
jgi:hypothetical protein